MSLFCLFSLAIFCINGAKDRNKTTTQEDVAKELKGDGYFVHRSVDGYKEHGDGTHHISEGKHNNNIFFIKY